MLALLFTLVALGITALPFVTLVWQFAFRRRIEELERELADQRRTVEALKLRLSRLEPETARPPAAEPLRAPAPAVRTEPRVETPRPEPALPLPPPPPPIQTPRPQPVAPPPPPAPPSRPAPPSPASRPPASPPRVPPPPPIPPASPWAAFDWEQLVGVRLFSAIAGVALVLAAVFFFRYSLDRGWLAPPVRVAIGVVVATVLLVLCELRAARRYRVTANALDAAAIAILFSTFFAAHALWNLIPTTATFGLLIIVTVLAVLLSVRHDSMFIAILGLVGGFATPALLSTGENRPIPLFTYLLLLNVGLAWVAVRMKWPVLTLLTLVLTTLYQWGWVIKFLAVSDLRLAMGIFLVFAVASFAALALGRSATKTSPLDAALEHSSVAAAGMPLLFAAFLAAVPRYGADASLLFGFLLIVVVGLAALAIARRDDRLHAMGGLATVLVFAIWPATSYASSAWRAVAAFAVAFAAVYATAPFVAARLRRTFDDLGERTAYVTPVLLFIFAAIARIEPQAASPFPLFAGVFVVLALTAWRAFASGDAGLYFIGGFFALAAEASWSATHLTAARLPAAVLLYAVFGAFYLGIPLAWRRLGRVMEPRWGAGAVLLASLVLLLFLAAGRSAATALWGLAFLLALLDAGLFIESAAAGLPILTAVGAVLSWVVLAAWWLRAGAEVGVLPSLLAFVGLTLLMLGGHAWAHRQALASGRKDETATTGFRDGLYLGLGGQLFLFFVAQEPLWAVPPWPLLGALTVMTLATTAAALAVRAPHLHAAGSVAAALVVLALSQSVPAIWAFAVIAAAQVVVAYAVVSLVVDRVALAPPSTDGERRARSVGALAVLFVSEFTVIAAAHAGADALVAQAAAHVVNLSLILFVAWSYRWPFAAEAAVIPAWLAAMGWQADHPAADAWKSTLALAGAMYAVFAAYPLVLGGRARDARSPFITAIAGSVFFFFAGRRALLSGGLSAFVGAVPVAAGAVLAVILRQLLRLQPAGQRDIGRVAIVAAAALGFATVAIPLQLSNQWITIGWALEGAALAWLYRRIPHKGLLYGAAALMAIVFARLVLNPAVFVYEPRGTVRVLNWYLYAYLTCAGAMLIAARWLARTDDRLAPELPRTSTLLTPAAVIVLFLLLNIEVADFFALGPSITFRFGKSVAEDLTYTLAWLVFGMGMLAAGIYAHNRYGRIAALALIAVTTSKAFLYDLGSLGGLYRVGSLVGLAASLALVALALQRFVLVAPKENP